MLFVALCIYWSLTYSTPWLISAIRPTEVFCFPTSAFRIPNSIPCIPFGDMRSTSLSTALVSRREQLDFALILNENFLMFTLPFSTVAGLRGPASRQHTRHPLPCCICHKKPCGIDDRIAENYDNSLYRSDIIRRIKHSF